MDNLMVRNSGEIQISVAAFSNQFHSFFQFVCMNLGSGAVVISSQFWGRIDTVITKDLSRLGRNYLESGAYIEVFFPQHHVRYITVNDGVDSEQSVGLGITPFKNILNEFIQRIFPKRSRTGSTYGHWKANSWGQLHQRSDCYSALP